MAHKAVHALIKNNNKYLVVRRSAIDEDDPNCWDLPGGMANFGEEINDALHREVKEEVGLEISSGQPLVYYHLSSDKDGESDELIVECDYLGGRVVLSYEHSNYLWVTREELFELKPAGDHLKQLIRHFKSNSLN